MSKNEMEDILWSVCDRIDSAISGQSEEVELDTRFETIGGGPGWQLIVEKGPYARTKLFSERIKAYVALIESSEDTYSYTIGKMSPFIRFPVERIYQALNKTEDITSQEDCWGGSNIIGGSPRKTGSRLSPEKLEKVINGCIKFEKN